MSRKIQIAYVSDGIYGYSIRGTLENLMPHLGLTPKSLYAKTTNGALKKIDVNQPVALAFFYEAWNTLMLYT